MIPNVRKVSMSPWVDEQRGAAEIGSDFVYSRKPSPAFLAFDTFDSSAVRDDLLATRRVCEKHNCPLEFILIEPGPITTDFGSNATKQFEKCCLCQEILFLFQITVHMNPHSYLQQFIFKKVSLFKRFFMVLKHNCIMLTNSFGAKMVNGCPKGCNYCWPGEKMVVFVTGANKRNGIGRAIELMS